MPTCTLTPDLPLMSPDVVVPDAVTLTPDGYTCGGPAGGGTLAVSGRPRAGLRDTGATGGVVASRTRAGVLHTGGGG